ncbi:MAG: hypothetical protein LUF90_09700 [Rikenellaceae bacterium]|nr:hypothetical protein [Rikenellaceae bacterium]
MKKVIQLILLLLTIVLCWVLYRQFASPMEFEKERKLRETVVVQRLKDIRSAQRAYKQVNGRFTSSFDTLINFVLHDSLTYQMSVGSMDDSLAVAQGLVRIVNFQMPVKDTIYSGRGFTERDIQEIRIIPFSGGQEFIMDAAEIETESSVVVQVFEAKAPYKTFLHDLDRQELINLIDRTKNTLNRYPGLKVGSLTEANNEAGNWE